MLCRSPTANSRSPILALFSVSDLFVIGTSLDLAGGFVLARGVLDSDSLLVGRSTSFWGWSAPVAVASAQGRVDGAIGLTWLAFGFLLQVAGYVAALATEPRLEASWLRAAAALFLAATAAAVALLSWRQVRSARVKARLVRMAHYEIVSTSETPVCRDLPSRERLLAYATLLEASQVEGEERAATIARVFGLHADQTADWPTLPTSGPET